MEQYYAVVFRQVMYAHSTFFISFLCIGLFCSRTEVYKQGEWNNKNVGVEQRQIRVWREWNDDERGDSLFLSSPCHFFSISDFSLFSFMKETLQSRELLSLWPVAMMMFKYMLLQRGTIKCKSNRVKVGSCCNRKKSANPFSTFLVCWIFVGFKMNSPIK